jgi:putative transposase
VDQDGDTLAIFVQHRRSQRAAPRFFRKRRKGQGASQRRIITDKLRSYSEAQRATLPSVPHVTDRYANNRVEVSHQ